jgi:multicomponent Na+:H+ antiporter subunit A
MVVGEVDVRTGTRNINELSGLRRTMPLAFAVAVVSGLSMAGVPPVLGFPAKEAAIEGVLGLDGTERLVVAGLIIAGSVLTAAYTVRLLIGMFGGGAPDRQASALRPAMAVPSVVLGVASLVGFLALGWVGDVVRAGAIVVAPRAEVYSLLRWPGLTEAFVASVLIVTVGAVAGIAAAQRVAVHGPAARGAKVADDTIDGIGRTARRIARRVQHGSLPLYLATMVVVVSATAVPFVGDIDTGALTWWDNRAQAALAVLIVVAALAATSVRSRLGAALVLGSVGFAVAGLFLVVGAPDLVLTQLLVETVIVLGFVLGLGRLASEFPKASRIWRTGRMAVSALVGTALAVALAGAASSPTGEPPIGELAETAVGVGGGNNVVNVILTDTRALDTLAEVIVLLTVAVGILTLASRRAPLRPTAPEGTEAAS